jgi:predicted phage terminase large subunit-like protein
MNPVTAHRHRKAVDYLKEVEQEDRELAERSMQHFFRCSWDVLEPKKVLHRGWYQDAIAEHLEATLNGQIKRLIINIPPRHAKSNMVTVSWPVWCWIHRPELRFICFSYANSLSTKHSVDRKSLIGSRWFQGHWSRSFQLAEGQNLKTEFANNMRGHMTATSLHGAATGKGGNILIIDDPHNPKRADSDQMREADLQQFDRTVRSRLDDQENGAIIIVMQRLHENDLTGHVLAEEPGEWTHLKIPSIATRRQTITYPKSGQVRIRNVGDVLLPEYQNKARLRKILRGMGSYGFAGQHQQEPSDPSGGILKRKWWKRWETLPPRFDRMITSADLSFKDSQDSAYCCFQAWGKKGADHYLLGQVRDFMEFSVALKEFEKFCQKHHRIHEHVVEDKANGPALISMLKKKIAGLVPFTPDRSKVARARAVSPTLESGNVYLPADEDEHPWVEDFIAECATFPKGTFADQVDTFTQALLRFQMDPEGDMTDDIIPTAGTTIAGSQGDGDQW